MNTPKVRQGRRDARAGWLTRERVLVLVLIVATALALYLCYLLARPFLPALAWALALAVIARPLHDRIAARLPNADIAAGLAVVLVALIILVPAIFVLQQLVQEAAGSVERVQAEAESGRWRTIIEQNPQLAPALRWIDQHVNVEDEARRALVALTADVASFVTGSVWASGIVLGPLILAVTDALIDVWRRRTAGGHTAEAGVKR